MRKAMEQMLYDNGVDIFFSGHIHAYEVRMFGLRARKEPEAFCVAVALSSALQTLLSQHLSSSHNLAVMLQRTNRVFNYTLDPCGIAHIMVRERTKHLCLLSDLQHQHI